MIDLFLLNENSSIEEMLLLAEELGSRGVVLAKHFESGKELNEFREKLSGEKIPLLFCHLVEAGKEVQGFKGKADFLAVLGGNAAVNKFAVSNKQIDFLLQPLASAQLSVDTAIARTASENGKPVAFTFSTLLNSKGFQRVMLFKNHLIAVRLLKKFRVNALMFSGAAKAAEVRSAKDLASVLVLLGFSVEQAERFSKSFPESFFKVKGK